MSTKMNSNKFGAFSALSLEETTTVAQDTEPPTANEFLHQLNLSGVKIGFASFRALLLALIAKLEQLGESTTQIDKLVAPILN